VRFGVRVDRAGAWDRIEEYLPPGSRRVENAAVQYLYSMRIGGDGPRPGLRRLTLLYGGGTRLARTDRLEDALEALESDLQLRVAARARKRIFVHAGVIGWRGRAILLPGRSHTGKSTLVTALLRAGATYYSDEFAVLDPAGRVWPYPRRLSLRSEAGGSPRRVTAADLGARTGSRPLPVALVALLSYRAGTRNRWRELPPGTALLEILANTVPARERPAESLTALHSVVSGARVIKGTRGDAEVAAERLLSMLTAPL
jgi:hypothetical protein